MIDEIWQKVSKDCKNLLKEMLTYDPDKRISASQALLRGFIKKYSLGGNVSDADLRLTLNNLRNFRTQSLFQKAVLTYFASQQLSQKEEAQMKRLFENFDTNKDGKLTKDELEVGYINIYKDPKKAKKEVEIIMRNIDFNKTGAIDYNGKCWINKWP